MSALDLAAADLLDRAAGRVARGWTQGANARTESGKPVGSGDRSACRWCMVGAIYADRASRTVVHHADDAASGLIPDGELAPWNDDGWRTQAEVVAALRTAAARLRGEA